MYGRGYGLRLGSSPARLMELLVSGGEQAGQGTLTPSPLPVGEGELLESLFLCNWAHFLRDGTPRLTWACHPDFPV